MGMEEGDRVKFGDNNYLWAIRDCNSNELVMLARSTHYVHGKHVFDTVLSALPNDEEMRSKIKGSFDMTTFTAAEWETWFVFDLAPAIELCVGDDSGRPNGSWKSITA